MAMTGDSTEENERRPKGSAWSFSSTGAHHVMKNPVQSETVPPREVRKVMAMQGGVDGGIRDQGDGRWFRW